jgi:hypothetical protein
MCPARSHSKRRVWCQHPSVINHTNHIIIIIIIIIIKLKQVKSGLDLD